MIKAGRICRAVTHAHAQGGRGRWLSTIFGNVTCRPSLDSPELLSSLDIDRSSSKFAVDMLS